MTNETTASERERFERDAFGRVYDEVANRRETTIRQIAWHCWKAARAALPAPADQVLVPKRLTRAMRAVLDEEGWTWEDLLAAAEAITEAEYSELQAAPADQPTSQEPQGSSGSLSESIAEQSRNTSRTRLNWALVREIRSDAAGGASVADLARRHGVSRGAIYGCVKQLTWRASDNSEQDQPKG